MYAIRGDDYNVLCLRERDEIWPSRNGSQKSCVKKCNGVVFSLVQVFLNSQELTEMNALRRNETFETNATIVHVYSGIISEPSEVRSSDPGSVL